MDSSRMLVAVVARKDICTLSEISLNSKKAYYCG